MEARSSTGAAAGRDQGVIAAATSPARKRGGRSGTESIVVVGKHDSELARQADALGVSAIVASAEVLDAAIMLALRRLQELQQLRDLQDRTALVERAKGVLMERHRLVEDDAISLLRRHARNRNLKLVEVARAVVESHLLVGAR